MPGPCSGNFMSLEFHGQNSSIDIALSQVQVSFPPLNAISKQNMFVLATLNKFKFMNKLRTPQPELPQWVLDYQKPIISTFKSTVFVQ